MFQKVIDIYNGKKEEDAPRLTLKTLAEMMEAEELVTSYQYGRKLMANIDAGTQLRINWKILVFTAEKCQISLNELFEQF